MKILFAALCYRCSSAVLLRENGIISFKLCVEEKSCERHSANISAESGLPSGGFQPKSLSCGGHHPFSWGQRWDQ